jgi:hypothetical protein
MHIRTDTESHSSLSSYSTTFGNESTRHRPKLIAGIGSEEAKYLVDSWRNLSSSHDLRHVLHVKVRQSDCARQPVLHRPLHPFPGSSPCSRACWALAAITVRLPIAVERGMDEYQVNLLQSELPAGHHTQVSQNSCYAVTRGRRVTPRPVRTEDRSGWRRRRPERCPCTRFWSSGRFLPVVH